MNDLSRETGALLDEGRDGESLSPADKMRLKRAVLAQVAAASVVGTTSTAAAWTTTAKTVGAILFVTSAAGGTAAILSSQSKSAKTAPQSSTVTVAPSKAASPRPLPIEVRALPGISSGISSAHVESMPESPALATSPAPASKSPPHTPSLLAANAAPVNPSVTPPSSLEVETSLLKEADEALKLGDPDRALGVLAQLANRFPRSALAPERSAERVFALCMAGRTDEARQEAGAFLTVQPTGPLALRVRGSCGGRAP